jgi:hypothetical protein
MFSCPRCGTGISQRTRMCPTCGIAFAQPQSAAGQGLGSMRKVAIGAVLAVTGLAFAFAGMHFSGSFRSKPVVAKTNPAMSATGQANRPTLNATGTGDSSTLSIPGEASPQPILTSQGNSAPTMQQAAPAPTPAMQDAAPAPSPILQDQPVTMPDDVRRWLEHLERIERARQALATQQLSSAVALLGNMKSQELQGAMDSDEDTTQDAARRRANQRASDYANSAEGLRASWNELLGRFKSVPPPAACVGVQAQYLTALGQTGSMILELVNIARNANQNPQAALQALTAMQGTSTGRIDTAAKATDGAVLQVCQRYNTNKWFEIKADFGAGLMQQLGY